MIVYLLADLIVALHFAFILFVVAGGVLSLRWPRAAWVHLPAVAWGAAVELFGWVCPLTPWENQLRSMGGGGHYQGDFLARYLGPLIYPDALTREIQLLLGVGVVAANVAIYAWVLNRRRKH
ncbi:MAG: DUF2784 domain-containing protein [Pseudomonadota bacterium]